MCVTRRNDEAWKRLTGGFHKGLTLTHTWYSTLLCPDLLLFGAKMLRRLETATPFSPISLMPPRDVGVEMQARDGSLPKGLHLLPGGSDVHCFATYDSCVQRIGVATDSILTPANSSLV